MSCFSEFLAYVEQYDSGKLWKDMTYKNYDLLWKASKTRLIKALREVGFTADEPSVAFAECATRVRERGYAALSDLTVQECLLGWYVWRRLESGEYKKWKFKKS